MAILLQMCCTSTERDKDFEKEAIEAIMAIMDGDDSLLNYVATSQIQEVKGFRKSVA